MPAVTLRPLSSGKLAIWNSEFGIWNSYAHSAIRLLLAGIISAHLTALTLAATAQVTGSARTALATVEDVRTRRPVVDVGPDDFVVQEGADAREVLSVRAADYPVVLMIDSGAAADDLSAIRKASKRFLERLGSERPVAVGIFDGRARMLAGFDADRSGLARQLDDLAATGAAARSPHEALELAASALAATGAPFTSIVLLSAGASEDRDLDQDASGPVSPRGAILHVVARRSSRSNEGSHSAASHGDEGLRALAEQSRGQFVTIFTAASFEAALDQLAARMTSELMIEYLVPKQSEATDVKLGVRLPGARVRGLGVR
jgi:hypothetical protein